MARIPIYREIRQPGGLLSTPRGRIASAACGALILVAAVASLGYGFGVGPAAGPVPFGTGEGPYSVVPNLFGGLPWNHAAPQSPLVRQSVEPGPMQAAQTLERGAALQSE